MAFAVLASATGIGTGLLLWERVKGTDTSKDFKASAESFSLLSLTPATTKSGAEEEKK